MPELRRVHRPAPGHSLIPISHISSHSPAGWIPFTHFGPLFVERVLSPNQVRAQLEKIIGEEPIRFEDALAEGTVTIQVGKIERATRPCQVIFDVPLTLQLDFSILLLGESYSGPASLNLRLVARTFEPAIIYLYARRVTDKDIVFEADIVETTSASTIQSS